MAQDVGQELFSRAINENPTLRSLMLTGSTVATRGPVLSKRRGDMPEALGGGIIDPTKINDGIECQVLRDVEVPHTQC